MKNIKENSGGAIKVIAIVVLIAGIIVSIVISANTYKALSWIGENTAGGALFGVLIVGILISWVIYKLIYGYGELIEYTAENGTYLESIEQMMAKLTKDEKAASSQPKTDHVETTPTPMSVVFAGNPNEVICTCCGEINSVKNTYCQTCGHKLK
ncbi:MAG: hypothetical protein LUH03_04410 [Oscillospiraceae bacterium]|nr:hypothetical protein [Oscillospiraceae bacterium]